MNLYKDTPISDINRDSFRRGPLVELIINSINNTVSSNHPCLVYGIYGKWGEGKTSLMNFIRARLFQNGKNDNINLVEFNPWLVNNEESLFREFFKTIIKDNTTEVKNVVNKYGSLVVFLAKTISKYALHVIGDTVEKGIDSIEKILDDQKETLSELKQSVSKAVANSGRHLVVMIDDVDRLDREELHILLRLIRQIADFDNCIYILAMDVDLVSNSIGSYYGAGNAQEGRKFLEKIVQVPIVLPKVPQSDMAEIVHNYLSDVLKDYSDTEQIKHIIDNVAPFISTLRDLKRYCNQLTFVLPHLKNEVNIADLCVLEAIKIVSNDSYNKIYERRSSLMHQIDPVQSVLDKDKTHEEAEANYKNAKEYIIKDLPNETAVIVDSALDALFNNNSFDPQISLDEKRVCTDIYFAKYFVLTVPSDVIPDKEIENLYQHVKNRHIKTVSNTFDDWLKDYSHSEILRASLYLIRMSKDNDEKRASAASTIACALSICQLSKGYPPTINTYSNIHAFIPYQILKPYMVDYSSDQYRSVVWYDKILDNTFEYIFRKAEISFCLNLLCSSDIIFNSGSYNGRSVLPILIDRFKSLDFDNEPWSGKETQFKFSKLLLSTLFEHWKNIDNDSFNAYANSLFDNDDIPYLKVMYKFINGENDKQDVTTFIILFRDQVNLIRERLNNEPESVLELNYVRLFRSNWEIVLENYKRNNGH